MDESCRPFTIDVPEAVLDDLRDRLDRRRRRPGGDGDWSRGVPASFLDTLVEHWRHHYDWRAQEQRLNELPQFAADVGGIPIHFFYQRGQGPDPVPIVLTHGWPWSFFDYVDLIGPLADPAAHGGDAADAFDVVVPSLPGFAFSTPLPRDDLNFWKTADLWVTLMTDVLGYDRFAAHGCDMGAMVTAQLAHRHRDRLIGIHTVGTLPPMVFNVERPWADVIAGVSAGLEPEHQAAGLALERRFAAHIGVQCLSPSTVAHAVQDSPTGLAAWLVEPRQRWSDCDGDVLRGFTLDHLVNTAMAYWVTGAFGSAVDFYANAWRYPWAPSHVRSPMMEAPTGISWFIHDRPPGEHGKRGAALFDVVYERDHERGGHFATVERPDAVIDDLRATFRLLRGTTPRPRPC